jgi:hypothetical protein
MSADEVAAEQTCMFGSEAQYCGVPATWHVLLPDARTMDCDVHIGWWDSHESEDRHQIDDICGLPGTEWVMSDQDPPGRCVIEGLGPGVADESMRAPYDVEAGETFMVRI